MESFAWEDKPSWSEIPLGLSEDRGLSDPDGTKIDQLSLWHFAQPEQQQVGEGAEEQWQDGSVIFEEIAGANFPGIRLVSDQWEV